MYMSIISFLSSSEVLSERVAHEKVVELHVIQRVKFPLFSSKCASCSRSGGGDLMSKEGKKILRCGKCKAVGYAAGKACTCKLCTGVFFSWREGERGRERERKKTVSDRHYMYMHIILSLSVIVKCTTCMCTVSVSVVIGAFTRFTIEVVAQRLLVCHLSSAFLSPNSHTRG